MPTAARGRNSLRCGPSAVLSLLSSGRGSPASGLTSQGVVFDEPNQFAAPNVAAFSRKKSFSRTVLERLASGQAAPGPHCCRLPLAVGAEMQHFHATVLQRHDLAQGHRTVGKGNAD